jgi:hypothetical protein
MKRRMKMKETELRLTALTQAQNHPVEGQTLVETAQQILDFLQAGNQDAAKEDKKKK